MPSPAEPHPEHYLLRVPALRSVENGCLGVSMVVEKIRSKILTQGNTRELVKLVDEEMDGVPRE